VYRFTSQFKKRIEESTGGIFVIVQAVSGIWYRQTNAVYYYRAADFG